MPRSKTISYSVFEPRGFKHVNKYFDTSQQFLLINMCKMSIKGIQNKTCLPHHW